MKRTLRRHEAAAVEVDAMLETNQTVTWMVGETPRRRTSSSQQARPSDVQTDPPGTASLRQQITQIIQRQAWGKFLLFSARILSFEPSLMNKQQVMNWRG